MTVGFSALGDERGSLSNLRGGRYLRGARVRDARRIERRSLELQLTDAERAERGGRTEKGLGAKHAGCRRHNLLFWGADG
jgi:hypothetical protein